MTPNVISPEEGDELKRLYAEITPLSEEINGILKRPGGMLTPEFAEADKRMAAIVRRIKAILGTTGQHWMA